MVPSTLQIEAIPLATAGEFELSDSETKRTRRLLYALNKQGNRRFRTQRESGLLLVWRIK